ncbi:MAG: restriction endonuclease subunit S [Sulfurospirillum sp.]|nr:restriction endonuclease subunit S [Sulfurospirillum sp.]
MSELPSGWMETILGEVATIINGGTPSTKNISYWGDDISWITPKDLSRQKTKYINKGEKSITTIGLEKSSARLLPRNTILFTSRAPIGYVTIAKQKLTTNQGFKNIITDEINTHFIFMYYWLINNAPYIEKQSSGSTFSEASTSLMKSLNIKLPSIKEQKAIANILSSFDNKIELLKEQNRTLEALSQAIFKEWFVDFNYPNATGEMISSEIGNIPKGWRVFKLKELVDTINGYSYKGKELVEQSNEALVTLKSFNRNGGFQTRGFKPFRGTPKSQQEVVIGDLIVAHTDLTQDAEVLGNPAFVFENAGFSKMYITMDLVKVVAKIDDIDNAFLYYTMKDRRFKGHCVGYSNGTTVLHLSKKAIPEYKIALPEDLKLAKEFSKLVYSFTNKISNNIIQIQTLQKTRDTLLPKLMSGKLRVKGFEDD